MRPRLEELFHAIADLPPEARERYFTDHQIDGNTRREVEELLALDASFDASLEKDIGQVAQGALSRLDPVGLRCGPYRLDVLLGNGGMGTVYSAERVDGEVAQRVAVKLLQPGATGPSLRLRFLAERQILATLSHPNIARLLDAGHREDGQPYLVMEYVEGRAIDVYATGISLRRKLDLFLKVCAAVSYLHRNLVVHRDLKPANILVTPDGEPKLLDFGIAKLLDLATDSGATGTAMLTPDYASPEQVNSGPVTTATDIYSLGAVLYKLLTGVSPHRFEANSPGAIALSISSGRITPPSKLVRGLKGDLELVVMKALRTEPQERYPSVDALADDLRAYLQRRPVQARSGDVWYRARRFLRRHWVSATAAALVVGSLSSGLYVANRQRTIAERRFQDLRQLSSRLIDLDRVIRTLPGSIEARQTLVAASLEYLEGLSRESRDDIELTQEISDGYWRMGRIQGVNAEYNLGDSAKAEQSLTKADALIDRVLAARRNDRNALFRAAVIAHDRMIVADTEARREDALNHAHRAAARLEAFLRRDDPKDPVRLEGLLRPGNARESERIGAATLYTNIALTFVNNHLNEEGARCARRGVELIEAIPSARDMTSGCLSVLAYALRFQGDLEGSLTTIRRARELSEHADYPSATARLFTRYAVMMREGRILGEKDSVSFERPAEAAEVLQRALNITEDAARKDANDAASRARVGTAARELGAILSDDNPGRALAVYDLGIRRLGETRTSLNARRNRAELMAMSSYPLRGLHRGSEAAARIATAIGILRETKDYPAERVRLGSPTAAVERALADQEAETGNPARALEVYEELLRLVLAGRPEPETSLPDAVALSRIYTAIAALGRRTGRSGRASEIEARRLELWQHWESRLPNSGFVRSRLEAARHAGTLTVPAAARWPAVKK
jgi:serine/threonine protein kinase